MRRRESNSISTKNIWRKERLRNDAREALQLAAAALAVPSLAQARKPWAGYLTAAFAVDDVRRLLALDAKADPAVRGALMRRPDPAKLGGALTPPASGWKPPVSTEAVLTDPREQLAVAAGAIIAHAVSARLARNHAGYDASASALANGASSPALDPADPVFRLSEGVRQAQAVTVTQFNAATASSAYGRALLDALAQLRS
jgi:hypothetical protein